MVARRPVRHVPRDLLRFRGEGQLRARRGVLQCLFERGAGVREVLLSRAAASAVWDDCCSWERGGAYGAVEVAAA